MPKIQQRIACKALVLHDNKVLILREAPTYEDGTNIGKFQLPGGRIEPGEPFLDGLTREIYEETGLDVTVGPPFYVGEWFPVIKGTKNQIVAVFFVCTTKSKQVKLSDEHDQFEWINPESYGEYDLVQPEGDVIRTYLCRIES